MASTKLIQTLLSKEDCEKILKRSLDHPVQLVSYKINKYHDNVAGFLGDHLILTIKFHSNKTSSHITYFMKTLPIFNTNQTDYVREAGIFKKEVLLYQNLLSELMKIRKFGPKCYFLKDNVIVLEDLKTKGFRMNPKDMFLTKNQCVAMLQTLARYHVSTMIYEEEWGMKLDEKFKEEIKETCFSFTEGQPRYKWLVTTTKCVTDLIKLIHSNGNIDEICSKYEKFIFTELELLLAPSKCFRNVLTHDDLWCNNLLFNDSNKCVFVDFQLTRYTPPVLDFLIALNLNLDCDHLQNNLETYVDIYYCFLTEELKKNNLSNDLLPKREFEESLEVYKLPALVETVMYGTHIFISEKLSNEIIQDFTKYNEFSFINRSKFAVKEFHDNPQYRDRNTPYLKLLVKTLANKN